MVMQQGMLQVLAGTAAGIAGDLLLSNVDCEDAVWRATGRSGHLWRVALVLGLAALLAVCIPARRATRIDPMVALRNE